VITWSDEQVELRSGLARHGAALSAEHLDLDRAGTFSREKWDVLRSVGLLAAPFGCEWGGLGCDFLTALYLFEGLGHVCRDSGLSFSATTSLVSTGIALADFGSDELKRKFLPGIADGSLIGAHAITEPDSGSDALSMRSSATRDGDVFRLTGSKAYCSNAPIADVLVVYAKSRPGGGPLGVTAFLVERASDGLTFGPPNSKMGLRTSPLGDVFLDDVVVPACNVIGRVGGGFMLLDHVMKREILFSFAVNLGEMQRRLEACIAYSTTRHQFGARISSFQMVAKRLVDMHVRLETSRKWIYDTAERMIAGEDVTVDVAISKLLTSEGNVASSLDAIQIFGGSGYMTDTGIEQGARDAIGSTIYSGTTEIQYNRIASMIGL
jgi:alkylation response protein AidB-like acyl-CoA dehydrogenase